MSVADNLHEKSPDIGNGSDESEFAVDISDKISLSMVNEKLDLLLTKFDQMETSMNSLERTVDILVNKQVAIDLTVAQLQIENADKSVSIINTEKCCASILELIEERALSFENAIRHASDEIKEQMASSIPVGADAIQSIITDESILELLQQQKTTTASAPVAVTPNKMILLENEVSYSRYDLELSSNLISKAPGGIRLDSDDSPLSTPVDENQSSKRRRSDAQISTDVSKNLFPSLGISNGPQITLTDPNTQKTFYVMKDKHDRHQVATNQELLKKETGFRHLLAYLFSSLFTEEELKFSSVDGSVRGTKAFDPARVDAIDKHLFDLYGARYTKFRISNQYKDILNKKCSRIRTKFNKIIANK
ncbi:unnamed protein product [Adineta ricciae]|uniref:BEN domain-containing protein n=1 Tax=Adineta ricciae TaxID=249248 RepID=A0A815B7B6_ADIRI|nr:unnamed protein product [Adineta ricciae]